MKKLKIPTFRSEAAEARWWYEHREVLDRDFEEAAKAGTLKKVDARGLAQAPVSLARYLDPTARGRPRETAAAGCAKWSALSDVHEIAAAPGT